MIPAEKAAWEKYLRKHNLAPGCLSCIYVERGEASPACGLHAEYSNLKSFPFKKVMPCFSLDFWCSPFVEMFHRLAPDEEREIQTLWHSWLERGERVEELEELECQKK